MSIIRHRISFICSQYNIICYFLEFICLGNLTNIVYYLCYYIIGDMLYQTVHDFGNGLLIFFIENYTNLLQNEQKIDNRCQKNYL